MPLTILSPSVAAAVAAATDQTSQRAALLAPFGSGDVTVRAVNGATLRDTVTYGPWVLDSNTPRGARLGPLLARSVASTGAPTAFVFRAGSTDIFSITAAVSPAAADIVLPAISGGIMATARTNLSDPVLDAFVVTANPALPVVGLVATTLELSVPSSGTVGAPVTVTVTPNGPIPAGGLSVTLSATNGGVLGATSLSFTSGSPAARTTTLVRATAGVTQVTMTNTGGLTNIGNPATFTAAAAAPPPAPPAGTIAQFLTSDGGTEPFTGGNSSAPTRTRWHNRLNVAWKRLPTSGPLVGRGNWLDAAQVEEGSTPYASTAGATSIGQVLTANVTALVQRWRANGLNRGFYLNTRGSAFPLTLHGRGDPTTTLRPRLLITTTTGSFDLTAAANACWAISTFTGAPSRDEFTVTAGSQPAIVRFDLSTVTGTVTAATLRCVAKNLGTGSTGQIIDVFEADPPTLVDPAGITSPVAGALTGYTDFNAYKAAALPSAILADDFASPGPFDTGFSPPATRTLNADTGTTYARGTLAGGGPAGSGTGSADIKTRVSQGTGVRGAPNVVYDELFGHYRWYMEPSFGTTQDDAIKIPAMGVQWGFWNPAGGGYWQQTTGNGGSRGTGLKVDPGSGANFRYEGHSVRFLTGNEPRALDDDPYRGWFGVGIYPYNLDQVQDFPDGEAFPGVVLRKEVWYDFDIRVRQNTMSGAQDGLGNFATANADGIYQVWINGYPAYSRTNYRWRRHPEMGVEGLWVDVYHGGQTPALVDMHYRIDQAVNSTAYVGPLAKPLPAWRPAAGEVATLTIANGGLTNNWRDALDSYYEPFYGVKAVNDYSGAFKNPHWGEYGATLFFGGGHAGCNYNGVIAAEYGEAAITFKRVCSATPWFGTGTDIQTRTDNGGSTATNPLTNLTYMESLIDGKPGSPHSYGSGDVIGPEHGGAQFGSFLRVVTAAVNRVNDNGAVAAHRLDFNDLLTGDATNRNWVRATNNFRSDLTNWFAPQLTAFVGPQQRVYIQTNNGTTNVRWYDIAQGDWVNGTGTTFGYDGADGFDSGIMFYVPSRGLLVCMYPVAGSMRVQWMDVTAAQPTLGGTATLGTAMTVAVPWSAGCWCPDNNRIIVAGANSDAGAVYEIAIPATLTDPWPVQRAALGSGQTLVPPDAAAGSGFTYKKWSYDERAKCIVYMPLASVSGPDSVIVYRPRGT